MKARLINQWLFGPQQTNTRPPKTPRVWEVVFYVRSQVSVVNEYIIMSDDKCRHRVVFTRATFATVKKRCSSTSPSFERLATKSFCELLASRSSYRPRHPLVREGPPNDTLREHQRPSVNGGSFLQGPWDGKARSDYPVGQ